MWGKRRERAFAKEEKERKKELSQKMREKERFNRRGERGQI